MWLWSVVWGYESEQRFWLTYVNLGTVLLELLRKYNVVYKFEFSDHRSEFSNLRN